MEIYSYPNNPRVMKALIAAQYNQVKIDNAEFQMGVDNKAEWFLNVNPSGLVPMLKTPEGYIAESNAIARYVAALKPETGLMGNTAMEKARIDQWMDYVNTAFHPILKNWIYPVLGYREPNPKMIQEAKKDIIRPLAAINSHLAKYTFIAGDRITVADIVLVCDLLTAMRMLFDADFRAPFPSLLRWFETCINQPEFLAVLGAVELCKEEAQPPKKEKPKKEEKPKEAPKPKVEEEPKPEKKKKPFEHLPPSPFDLDNWKRIYSNTKENFYSCMDEFWKLYDAEGWSLWVCDFQYNEENKKGFMTSNLVGGFIQRCDSLRMYAFGNMNILRKEGEDFYRIRGGWLFRDQNADLMMEENPDAPSYKWTKLELTEEGKKTIADLWCASESIDGMEIYANEVFK